MVLKWTSDLDQQCVLSEMTLKRLDPTETLDDHLLKRIRSYLHETGEYYRTIARLRGMLLRMARAGISALPYLV